MADGDGALIVSIVIDDTTVVSAATIVATIVEFKRVSIHELSNCHDNDDDARKAVGDHYEIYTKNVGDGILLGSSRQDGLERSPQGTGW